MPVGRPDFWYGQVLLFESAPTDGRTDAGPTSDWAYDHKADAAAHHAAFISADAAALIATHTAIAAAHHAAFVSADAAALIATHTAIAAAHHAAFVSADAAALIATHTAIAAAHHAAFVAADAAALIATHTAIAAAHHAAFVAADAEALIATHTAIAAAHHAKTVSADIDHGGVGGLADDDHTLYLRANGARHLTDNLQSTDINFQMRSVRTGLNTILFGAVQHFSAAFQVHDETLWTALFVVDMSGNLTMLGTVDGVDIAAHAANVSAHHLRYADRGDPAAADKGQADLTCDSTWRDWNLSAIVPAGATAVLIRVYMRRDDEGGSILLRKNGNNNAFNVGGLTHGAAGTLAWGEITVSCDANRVIEYYGIGAAWTSLNLTVGGWWG